MTTFTLPVGSFSSLTVAGLGTLASATYVASNDIDLTTGPIDVQIVVEATPGTVSGNKQLAIFAQASVDGSTYSTGPTSSTDTTNEANLYYVGALPLLSSTTQQRGLFYLSSAFRTMPKHARLIFKNDSGAALSAAAVTYALVSSVGT